MGVSSFTPAINYDNLLLGDSSSFRGTNGDWTNSGGTLSFDSTIAYMWPNNNTGSLKLITTATGQYADCVVPGLFKSGVMYEAFFVYTLEENETCDATFEFGLIGTDDAISTLVSSGTEEKYNDARHALIIVRWIPTADRSGVSVRMTRTEASGTKTLHLAYINVHRSLPTNSIPIIGSPETDAAAPDSGLGLYVKPGAQTTRLSAGGKFNGGIEFDDGVGVTMSIDTDGTVGIPYTALGVSAVGIWMQAETTVSASDLSDAGINQETGPDYVGLFISEKDSDTVQFYADVSGGYDMQLRHRGSGKGWSASDDGTVKARIDSFFEWVFQVAGTLTVDTDVSSYFKCGYKTRIDEVQGHVGTAPTDASLIIDVNDDGVTVFTTQGNRPTIVSAGTDDTSEAADGGTAIAKDSVITIDVDQIGSTIAGADLTIHIRGRYIW